MMKAKKLFKKKNWAYYLCLFVVFTVAYFLVALLFDKHELRRSIISGLVGGVGFTVLWWLIDQAFEQIKSSDKEDEANRKRTGKTERSSFTC